MHIIVHHRGLVCSQIAYIPAPSPCDENQNVRSIHEDGRLSRARSPSWNKRYFLLETVFGVMYICSHDESNEMMKRTEANKANEY